MSTFYTHDDKQSGDGLAITDWNELSNAVAGNQGLHLARNADDKVGIGTTSPSAKLEVNGTTKLNGDVDIATSGSLFFGAQTRQMINLWHNSYGIGIQGATQYYRTGKNFAWYKGGSHNNSELNPGGGTVQMVIKDGNVGIGMDNPSEKLDVHGKVKASHFIGNGASLTNLDASKITTGKLAVEQLPNGIVVASGGNTTFTGNVGIGTTSPSAKLEVAGTTKLNGDVDIATSGSLSFGAQTRQMINLWHNSYGIGIQGSTQYYRTDKNFAWYKGGSHNNSELNPGGGTVQMVIKDGNVGIGMKNPSERLEVRGNIRLSHSSSRFLNLNYNEPDGRFEVQMDTNSSRHGRVNSNYHNKVTWNGDNNWDFLSDKRLKKNISKVEDILGRLIQLQVVNYNWVYSDDNEPKMTGFIAQDVEPLFPSVVGKTVDDKTKEERLTLGYTSFGVLAVGAIKELNDKLEKAIKESNDKFEETLEKLTKKVNVLAKKVK